MRSAPDRLPGKVLVGLVGLIAALAGFAHAGPRLSGQAFDLDTVLERARLYVATYQELLGSVIAEEEYAQEAVWFDGKRPRSIVARERRRLSSDFLLVRVGDLWQGVRTVLSVDGVPVEAPETAPESLEEIIAASRSSRYDLGGFTRTFNVPTWGLVALEPGMSSRFAFEDRGEREVEDVRVREIRFSEVLSPTLVQGGTSEDRPANGRVWVRPETGEVLKTEVILRAEAAGTPYQATMTVTYKASLRLDLLVPSRMEERYESALHSVETRADYVNFQRFTTAVSSTVPSVP